MSRNTVDIQTENLNSAGWRVQACLVSSLDEESARAQRAQTAASIPALESSYRGSLNRIAVLIGQAPGAATDVVENGGPVPDGPDNIPVGIPAETLRQRPEERKSVGLGRRVADRVNLACIRRITQTNT